jgi:hypothetical protein
MSRHPDPGLDHGFDPHIADWLEADPDHAPPDVMRTVESAIPSIPQRRVLRLPWRNLSMTGAARAGKLVEAAAVDESTNVIAEQIHAFEANYNLRPCP